MPELSDEHTVQKVQRMVKYRNIRIALVQSVSLGEHFTWNGGHSALVKASLQQNIWGDAIWGDTLHYDTLHYDNC